MKELWRVSTEHGFSILCTRDEVPGWLTYIIQQGSVPTFQRISTIETKLQAAKS